MKVGSLIGQHEDASRVRMGNCRRSRKRPSWSETVIPSQHLLLYSFAIDTAYLTQRKPFGRARLEVLEA